MHFGRSIVFFKKIWKGIKKIFKPVGRIAKSVVGSIPFVGPILTGAGEAVFGGRSEGRAGGGILQGIGGAFGQSLGHAAGGLIAAKGGQLLGLTPKPQQPKSVEQNIADTRKYLDGVFPGTNPWERLGVNAGSPMEIAQENQRTAQQQSAASLRAQMSFQAGQFAAQRQLQEAELSTRKQLKKLELATTKDIAKITARANILSNVGVSDPGSVAGAHQYIETGQVSPAYASRLGTLAAQEEQVNINAERAIAESRRVRVQERQQFLREVIDPLMALARRVEVAKGGGPGGVAANIALTGVSKPLMRELIKKGPEWLEQELKRRFREGN